MVLVFITIGIATIWITLQIGIHIGKKDEFLRKIQLEEFLNRRIEELETRPGIKNLHELEAALSGQYRAYKGLLELINMWERRLL